MELEVDKEIKIAPYDFAAAGMLAAQTGLSRISAALLVQRGIRTAEQADRFLHPDLERDWLDPLIIPGMAQVADAVEAQIRAGGGILVYGDFDVDGISATAVMLEGLRVFAAPFGCELKYMIPRRSDEGYGLSENALKRLLSMEPDMVLTVDNGISAKNEALQLIEAGIKLVITDHHEPGDAVPEGIPLADPKLDPSCPSSDLAGVGVACKLIQVLGQRFGQPDLWKSMVDLASLGTVADQMQLSSENRALVAAGLKRMNNEPSPAIAAFIASNPKNAPVSTEGLSFGLIPRINSAGRVGDCAPALDLLMARDFQEARRCLEILDSLNDLRRERESEFTAAALEQSESKYHGERALVLGSEGWHEGVKGIVAARLAGKFHVPTILFSYIDGVAHGSGRSFGQVNLFKALEPCADLLSRYGGHEAAVGVTLPVERVDEFRQRLCNYMETLPAEQFVPQSDIDLEVSIGELSLQLCDELDLLAPFGQGNRSPVFLLRNVFLEDRRRMGNPALHFSCSVTDGGSEIRAVRFNADNLEQLMEYDSPCNLSFSLGRNEFRGRCSAQLRCKDFFLDKPLPDESDSEFKQYLRDLDAKGEESLQKGDYKNIADAESFFSKLAGVSFEDRQELLKQLKAGISLDLRREADNAYDPNAIAVDYQGRQLGFLNARLAANLAPAIDAGARYDVLLTELTGLEEGRTLGANVWLSKHGAQEQEAERCRELAERRSQWKGLSPEELERSLLRSFIGDHSLHAAQKQALDSLAAGRNTLCVMATGRGKSLIFQMHAARTALLQGKASVFIYPLRALVADQAFHLQQSFGKMGLRVELLTGESSEQRRDDVFSALAEGRIDCILSTPEFLSIHAQRFAQSGRIAFLAVDEAHHAGMSKAGHRPAYQGLARTRELLGNPLTLAVTATASTECAENICELLDIRSVVCDPSVRENLRIVDFRDVRDRDLRLAHIVASGDKTVVYVNSREQSLRLARMLRGRIPSLASKICHYNAGLPKEDRQKIEAAFRDGRFSCIISTSAFGEGVNIPDIRNVVLYHLPFNAVEFNQMAGRAGRDGDAAYISLLFGKGDIRINQRILASSAPSREDLVSLYRVLRSCSESMAQEDGSFKISNADLAQRALKLKADCKLDESGVSCGISVFKELGFLLCSGYGAARRICMIQNAPKVELSESIRYSEGCQELAQFDDFQAWALSAYPQELLERFNRPILPQLS